MKKPRGKMIPDELQKQIAAAGLRFEAYLPPDLALWVVELVEQGVFTSPSEAVFVAMQTFQELERHPSVKKELLRAIIADAAKEAEQGKGIPHEKVMAKLEKMNSQSSEPAVWHRSMDRPFFEE